MAVGGTVAVAGTVGSEVAAVGGSVGPAVGGTSVAPLTVASAVGLGTAGAAVFGSRVAVGDEQAAENSRTASVVMIDDRFIGWHSITEGARVIGKW